MRKKVWLVRDSGGDYTICMDKPDKVNDYLPWNNPPYALAKELCPELVKKWCGLKRQLRKSTCVQGYFDVSFTPIKRKGE